MYDCHAAETQQNRSMSKGMVTRVEKWVNYDNLKQKRSWSNQGWLAHMLAKSGLTARNILLCVGIT